jgi:hypothetical protein
MEGTNPMRVETGKRDKTPLASVAAQLADEFPTAPLLHVVAAVEQASLETSGSTAPARLRERAKLILRAGLERFN